MMADKVFYGLPKVKQVAPTLPGQRWVVRLVSPAQEFPLGWVAAISPLTLRYEAQRDVSIKSLRISAPAALRALRHALGVPDAAWLPARIPPVNMATGQLLTLEWAAEQ